MSKQKDVDIFDILEPAEITIKYKDGNEMPFEDANWLQSSDQAILEFTKLFPNQLPFLCSLLNEYPELIPNNKAIPGLMEELVLREIISDLKSKRKTKMVSKVVQLWKNIGGIPVNDLKNKGD
jgi:hypothetical protein